MQHAGATPCRGGGEAGAGEGFHRLPSLVHKSGACRGGGEAEASGGFHGLPVLLHKKGGMSRRVVVSALKVPPPCCENPPNLPLRKVTRSYNAPLNKICDFPGFGGEAGKSRRVLFRISYFLPVPPRSGGEARAQTDPKCNAEGPRTRGPSLWANGSNFAPPESHKIM